MVTKLQYKDNAREKRSSSRRLSISPPLPRYIFFRLEVSLLPITYLQKSRGLPLDTCFATLSVTTDVAKTFHKEFSVLCHDSPLPRRVSHPCRRKVDFRWRKNLKSLHDSIRKYVCSVVAQAGRVNSAHAVLSASLHTYYTYFSHMWDLTVRNHRTRWALFLLISYFSSLSKQ